jgi:hypothetical protein
MEQVGHLHLEIDAMNAREQFLQHPTFDLDNFTLLVERSE